MYWKNELTIWATAKEKKRKNNLSFEFIENRIRERWSRKGILWAETEKQKVTGTRNRQLSVSGVLNAYDYVQIRFYLARSFDIVVSLKLVKGVNTLGSREIVSEYAYHGQIPCIARVFFFKNEKIIKTIKFERKCYIVFIEIKSKNFLR